MKAKIKTLSGATPDLNDVALFVDVVEAESFSAAAKSRGVPVSTVSRRVARLEGALGARLLERTTRTLRLTEIGRAYVDHAGRALDELKRGGNEVRAQHSEPRGRVRITAPIGLGQWVTNGLAEYLVRYPQVSVEVDLTERRVDLLNEGYDIALRGGTVDSADFVARKLSEAARGLFASRAYVERRGRPKSLSDLPSHDLIATRANASGAVWELFATKRSGGQGRRERVAFKPRLFVNELLSARNAVARGVGIAMLPTPDVDRGEFERILPRYAGERGGLWLLYPTRRSLTAAVRSCVDHLLVALPQSPR